MILRLRSKTISPWIPGRQGTGYDKALLRDRLYDVEGPVLQRGLKEVTGGQQLPDDWELWDAWLLRYPDGAHIAPHTDPAREGHRHVRLNALLKAPEGGGELTVDGQKVALEVGDAIVFAPDVQPHEVSRVTGERLLFSLGAWLPWR